MAESPVFRAGIRGGPALLWWHGFGGDASEFDDFWSVWRAEDARDFEQYEHWILELPGHGQVASVHQPAWSSASNWMRQVADRLFHIHPHWHGWIGYSLGARVGVSVLREFLARRGAVQCALWEGLNPGLLDGDASGRRERKQRDADLARALLTHDGEVFWQTWYDQPLFTGLKESPFFADLLRRRRRAPRDGLAASLRYFGQAEMPDLRPCLDPPPIPTRLVYGAEDPTLAKIPPSWQEPTGTLNTAKISGASHNVHTMRPQEFARVVSSWLSMETTSPVPPRSL